MSLSSAGRAASSSGCVARPRGHEIGSSGFAVQIRLSSLTGSYVMATAEHREPYESRGSRTVLGAPGGESPPGDSPRAAVEDRARLVRSTPDCGHAGLSRFFGSGSLADLKLRLSGVKLSWSR